jgi:integrase
MPAPGTKNTNDYGLVSSLCVKSLPHRVDLSCLELVWSAIITPMAVRGTGRVFQPSYTYRGKLKKSAVWHIEFWHNGQVHRESSKSRNVSDAKRLLKQRLGEAGTGTLLPSDVARTTFEDLKTEVTNDYARNDRRSADQLKVVLKRLASGFAGMKATELTAGRISAYQAQQKKAGYANATINRDMAALKRAFRLAHRHGLVATVPHIELLHEDNVREGFFEPDEFKAVLKELPEHLKAVFRVAYITGWRVKSELLSREWQHVDFVHSKLRIDPGEDKNQSGREFPFTPELETLFKQQRKLADRIQKTRNVIVRAVFFDADGAPVRSYRKGWKAATEASGVNRIPHDFRRTAVRNLEMAGVPRSTAMKMVGHRTQSIYSRYAIVDEGMMQEGARKLAILHKQHAAVKARPRKVVSLQVV